MGFFAFCGVLAMLLSWHSWLPGRAARPQRLVAYIPLIPITTASSISGLSP